MDRRRSLPRGAALMDPGFGVGDVSAARTRSNVSWLNVSHAA